VTLGELIDRWEAAWTDRDVTAFAEVCAPDLHYEDPLTAPALRGPVELGEHARRLWTGFPDARVEQTGERMSDGRFAVAPCKLVGTHLAELEGLPASGRTLVVHVVFYCELEPHRMRLWRVRGFFDVYGAAVELGVLPRRGTVSERALLMLRGYGLRSLRGRRGA
jgi:steroid delta-isomerase-like uncharacterized protein